MKCSSFLITSPRNFTEFEKVGRGIGRNFPRKTVGIVHACAVQQWRYA